MDTGFDPFELMKYFWVLAYAAIIGIAYLIGKLAMRKRLNKLRDLAPFLSAQAVSGFMGPRLEGVKGGRKFRVTVLSGGKGSPPVLRLTIESFLPVSFTIHRPTSLTGLLGSFLKRAPTGDPEFDAEFFCSSPDATAFASVFSDARRRDAARGLLNRGYQQVEVKKGEAAAILPSSDIDTELDPARISGALDDLAGLSA
ncbi:MAG: hypothetical protein FD189_738 [Elusimicrobia bacterium]|nr:MAG: hypothetical protein FD154_669 [Elusimicrobiota bacterium]KAF0156984.1 MAG: hypothetical protein FD189_738 [Elusimicrobiota bacterium]